MTQQDLGIEFGNNLRDILIDYNMSHGELAKAIGVSAATISYYINGERIPSFKNFVNIMYILDCSYDELIGTYELIE